MATQITTIPANAIVIPCESFTTSGVYYKIWFDPATLKYGCTCPHFENRLTPKQEENPDASPTCKHMDRVSFIDVVLAVRERKRQIENEHGLGTVKQ
jgi:hypothetical protein